MMNIGCVILDMDGTLLDNGPNAIHAWQLAGRENGYDIPRDFIISNFGMSKAAIDRRYLAHYGPDFPIASIRAARDREIMRIAGEEPVPVMPGAKALLSYLNKIQIPAVLATSTEQNQARLLLQRGGLWSYFDAIVCNNGNYPSKPSPDIFLAAAQSVGVSPSRSLVVEDSENGAAAGLAAGMQVALIPYMGSVAHDILARVTVLPSLEAVVERIGQG